MSVFCNDKVVGVISLQFGKRHKGDAKMSDWPINGYELSGHNDWVFGETDGRHIMTDIQFYIMTCILS